MRKNKNNSTQLAERWLQRADEDINDARILFKDQGFTDNICLFCHQAIEKYLKGFLVFKNIKPKWTHNLVGLLDECAKADKDFEDWLEECEYLNRYYREAKYPPNAPVGYSREETGKAIEYTEQLIKFVKNKTN